jgi:hypothetical protein
MAPLRCLDFVLQFDRMDGEYRIKYVQGDTTAFLLATEIVPLLLESEWSDSSGLKLHQQARSIGKKLFPTIFQYEILERFTVVRQAARSADMGLRLQLDFEGSEELDDLPWELLFDSKSLGEFSVVRRVPSAGLTGDPRQAKPLRVLACFPCPVDLASFDVEREWEDLQRSLHSLIQRGTVALERLEEASEAGLRRALSQREFHVLHFVGYGHSSLRTRSGSIFLEAQQKSSRAVTAGYLATLLNQYPSVRLAVFYIGGNDGVSNPFSETARTLVRKSMTAVVAMRHRLNSSSTVLFNQLLYASLELGLSIDQSVAKARQSLAEQSPEVNWDSPMLYMAPGDGRLFEVDRRTEMQLATPGNPEPEMDRPLAPAEIQKTLDGKRTRAEFDVFICYRAADRLAVLKICQGLESHGILPWIDERENRPGLPWLKNLEQQIQLCKSAAIFVGCDGMGPWQEEEAYAFLQEFVRRKCPIIPVFLENAPETPELPFLLRSFTWVDFRQSRMNSLERLIWGITGRR